MKKLISQPRQGH